jgi:hypothetical protein
MFENYSRRKFLSSFFAPQSRWKFQRRRRGIFVVHQPKNNKLRQERHIPMPLLMEPKFILIWISTNMPRPRRFAAVFFSDKIFYTDFTDSHGLKFHP